MLVLERKMGQAIQIGEDITVTLVRRNGNGIKVGIEAPQEIKILRTELIDKSKLHTIYGEKYDESANDN